MANNLRNPTLGLALLSLGLSIAVIGTAGRSLHVYYSEHSTNMWLLPVWPNHFDLRELQMLVGSAAAVVVCNLVLGTSLVVAKVSILLTFDGGRANADIRLQLPANGIVVVSSFLSTIVMMIALIFTTVLNWRAPHRDTLKTWTCRWSNVPRSLYSLGPPEQFHDLCQKTRFAYFSLIPLFILQVALLGLGIWALFSKRPQRSGHRELEKGGDYPLSNVQRQNVSFETKSASPQSYQTRNFSGGKS
ncbi:uncharacterized protein LTR77_008209 [Saxophila tyrrhenica]|uniref:Uncharacterized protein n=1 Tax=Saxophila tyrrhenica TaxID=1690608 RepID=A0AAV9P266_9PEZI|nr:hypothetical protein LTR77_008209 [Saxophila tyrrhenica]